MPEILEIETYRRLAELAVGRTIAGVSAPDAWFLKGGIDAGAVIDAFTGTTIETTRRRGKLLMLDTSGPVLGLRFGMTGRLLVDGEAAIDSLEYSSDRNDPAWDRFGLDFVGGGGLVLRDPRRLGGVEINPDDEALGPDAWSIGAAGLRDVLAGSKAPLKARLMDQKRLAGLGNLLTDEILWRSALDPVRPANEVDATEVKRLHRTMRRVLDQLDERGGSHQGDLQDQRSRDGVCPRDGAPLERRKVGGRTTYSCPQHQL